MNYRHAFHAGNHADVLKHIALLAVCDALTAKPTPCFALDTHAGRGLYQLDADAAQRTGEAEGGIAQMTGRFRGQAPQVPQSAAIARYLAAISACRNQHGPQAYPGSPWLLAHALREQDRIACCELQPEEATELKRQLGGEAHVAVHQRDGYAAVKALLPPKLGDVRFARGLVLIDPPYEAQLDEFEQILDALRSGLQRWPQATFMLWYPIKQRLTLRPFFRRARNLPAKQLLVAELLVRPDDSPLRMNGSGLLICNPPWKLDETLTPAVRELQKTMGEKGSFSRVEWLEPAPGALRSPSRGS